MTSFDYRPIQRTRKDKILPRGFISLDEETGKFKVGDGLTKWGLLPWLPTDIGSSPGIRHIAVAVTWDTPNLTPPEWPITDVDDGASTFEIDGDHTALLPEGSVFAVGGSTGNDGTYTVDSCSFVAGTTTVVAVEPVPDATVDGTLSNVTTLGVVIYEPAEGEALIDTRFEVTENWTDSAKADIGTFADADRPTAGIWWYTNGAPNLTSPGLLTIDKSGLLLTTAGSPESFAANTAYNGYDGAFAPFANTAPWKVVVSETGETDGGGSGGPTGALVVHMLIAPAPVEP